jgi:hypothetical protein
MCARCSTHLTVLDFIILIILSEDYKLCSSSLCDFLHPPVTSFLSGQNILLSNLFSNTFNVRDQISHPYETTGKIIVSNILIFTFLDGGREDKIF